MPPDVGRRGPRQHLVAERVDEVDRVRAARQRARPPRVGAHDDDVRMLGEPLGGRRRASPVASHTRCTRSRSRPCIVRAWRVA